jgi:hypothetical protein
MTWRTKQQHDKTQDSHDNEGLTSAPTIGEAADGNNHLREFRELEGT